MKISTGTLPGAKVVSDNLGNIDHVFYALVNPITTIVAGILIVMENNQYYITSNNNPQALEADLLVIFPSAILVEVGSLDGTY